MKIQVILTSIFVTCILASCSSDDYLTAVPADCQALAAIDMMELVETITF